MQAKQEIEKKIKKKIQIVDLRWLSEINVKKLLHTIGNSSKVLIVEECRKSGSYGEGLLSDLQVASKSSLKIKLHAAQDSFIPIGEGATSTLPNKDSIVKIAQELYNE